MAFRILILATKVLEIIVVLVKYILSQSKVNNWSVKREMKLNEQYKERYKN